MPHLLVAVLGLAPYADTLALMRASAAARVAGTLDEDVLLSLARTLEAAFR